MGWRSIQATSTGADSNASTIGRADLDGQNATTSFISVASYPYGVAVDSNHIYWANPNGSIGRADLDGQAVDNTFISVIGGLPTGVAVDSGHVFWTDEAVGSIGRADLDGQNVDDTFIPAAAPPGMGPVFLTVDSSHIYWSDGRRPDASLRPTSTGRTSIYGFLTDMSFTLGLAVDSNYTHWTHTQLGGAIHARAT